MFLLVMFYVIDWKLIEVNSFSILELIVSRSLSGWQAPFFCCQKEIIIIRIITPEIFILNTDNADSTDNLTQILTISQVYYFPQKSQKSQKFFIVLYAVYIIEYYMLCAEYFILQILY